MKIEVQFVKLPTISPENYIYLICDRDSKEGIIIDPAWDLEPIESMLLRNDVNLSKILLTHYNYDHVNLADDLAQKYAVQVLMNKIEIDFYSFDCRNLSAIDESKPVSLGQWNITPIHTPGHTKGSTCYLIGNTLFTGDTLFIEGCGLCFGKGANPNEMFDSLQKLKSRIDPETAIYPSHSYGRDPGKKFGYLLRNNIYLQIDDQEQFISFRMRENQCKLFDFR